MHHGVSNQACSIHEECVTLAALGHVYVNIVLQQLGMAFASLEAFGTLYGMINACPFIMFSKCS